MFLYNLSIDKDSLKMIQSPKAKNKRNRDIDVENGHVDTGGEGEGGTNWEIRFDINTLPCVKQIASENLLYSTGSSTWCSVTT